MARYIAKNLVAAGIADEIEIQIAYAIGIAEPVSLNVNTFGTSKIKDNEITRIIRECFELTPEGIISSLKLIRPIYKKTAAYGHFGRELPEFTWEATDKVDLIKSKLKK
jgi:S-adenosylmethionine synthetase